MTGDQADFLARIKALLPSSWFGDDETPVLDGLVTQPAAVYALVYQLISYVELQLRISTSTGAFLDLTAYDFFGPLLPRITGETDPAYLARIKAGFFPKRNTIAAVLAAVEALGCTATVMEPWNPGETNVIGKTLYNNVAGVLGSRTLPGQSFITVTVPPGISVTDAQIYAAIEAVRMEGTIIWACINQNGGAGGTLDFSDPDESALIGH